MTLKQPFNLMSQRKDKKKYFLLLHFDTFNSIWLIFLVVKIIFPQTVFLFVMFIVCFVYRCFYFQPKHNENAKAESEKNTL